MGFTREDKESRKFEADPADSSKFLVKTKVENADGDPVPVKIVTDDTDAPSVQTVDGTVSISGTTTVDGTVAVSGVAGTTDVNVTNSDITTKSKVYDGSTWRNELCDANGRTITRSQKYYTTADITALASSTDVPLWLSAYADGVLVKNYNFNHTSANQPIIAYYTFPTLGDSSKCLKMINTYTGSNLTSVVASVVDWTFDDALAPAATLAKGGISSPANDATAGTDVCTITPGGGGGGATYTIVVTGTDNDKYRLANTTQGTTGTTITAIPGDSVVLETSVTFDLGATGYSHSVTVTSTEDVGSTSANVSVATTQTADASYSNDKYWEYPADDDTCEWGDAGTSGQGQFGNLNTIGVPSSLGAWTTSIWMKFTNAPSASHSYLVWYMHDATGTQQQMGILGAAFADGTTYQRMMWKVIFYQAGGMNLNINPGFFYHDVDTWYNIVFVKHATSSGAAVTADDVDIWINGEEKTTVVSGSGTWDDFTMDSVAGAYTAVLSPAWVSQSGLAGWGLDEYANWDRALTSSEIAAIYNSGDPGDLSSISNLRGWWRFGDGDSTGDGSGTADSSQTIHDMSGGAGAVDLTLQNYSGSATDMIKDH